MSKPDLEETRATFLFYIFSGCIYVYCLRCSDVYSILSCLLVSGILILTPACWTRGASLISPIPPHNKTNEAPTPVPTGGATGYVVIVLGVFFEKLRKKSFSMFRDAYYRLPCFV